MNALSSRHKWYLDYKISKQAEAKEEPYTEIKMVELWHGVNSSKALKEMEGHYYLTPNPKEPKEYRKLWFAPAWSEENRKLALNYADYALVKVKVPFKFTKVKITKEDGTTHDRVEEYEPAESRWDRTYQVQEWYLYDGVLKLNPGQVEIFGKKEASISIRAKDKLKEYKKKREFDKTPEPEGKVSKRDKKRFVIHNHHATKHHWDLRLEHDGVLQSWALPKHKLPSAGEKQLAVKTEAHPMSYMKFEGDIPEGSYGAGESKIHDSGKYELVKWEKNTIKFKLEGKKEKGAYTLHKTDGKNWMIMRMKEE